MKEFFSQRTKIDIVVVIMNKMTIKKQHIKKLLILIIILGKIFLVIPIRK